MANHPNRAVNLVSANRIAEKVGKSIRALSSKERADALYRGMKNPRWAIDMGEYQSREAFDTVRQALLVIAERQWDELSSQPLTKSQRNILRSIGFSIAD